MQRKKKYDASEFANNSDLDQTLATKPALRSEPDKIVKLQAYDSSLFIGQSYFLNDRSQNLLIF